VSLRAVVSEKERVERERDCLRNKERKKKRDGSISSQLKLKQ
jgi:hypothetical protein